MSGPEFLDAEVYLALIWFEAGRVTFSASFHLELTKALAAKVPHCHCCYSKGSRQRELQAFPGASVCSLICQTQYNGRKDVF